MNLFPILVTGNSTTTTTADATLGGFLTINTIYALIIVFIAFVTVLVVVLIARNLKDSFGDFLKGEWKWEL